MVKSLNIDYKVNPYRWEVSLTPKGALMVHTDFRTGPVDIAGEDIDVLSYLEQTETGSAELQAMGYELKYPNIKSIVKKLKSLGFVTIRFLHDMGSELQ